MLIELRDNKTNETLCFAKVDALPRVGEIVHFTKDGETGGRKGKVTSVEHELRAMKVKCTSLVNITEIKP